METKLPYVYPKELLRPVSVLFGWTPHLYHLRCGACERLFTKIAMFGRVKCLCGSVNIVRYDSVGY